MQDKTNIVKVTLRPGCILEIALEDDEGYPIDGVTEVHFDTKRFPKRLVIDDLYDKGIVYDYKFES